MLRTWSIFRALAAGLMVAGGAWADPGHEITVADLTAQIAKTPDIPELYFQRAWNYREMAKPAEALADFEKTLRLNPGFLPASRELARDEGTQGKLDAGIDRLKKAIAAAPPAQAFHIPGCDSVLADLLLKSGKNAEALEVAGDGLKRSPDLLLDLCLLRAEAQRRLGKHEDRIRDLSQAMSKIRSFVLKEKWYDAMIDAGRGGEILPEIEEELGNTRYQATWLIRRARIRLQEGNRAGAESDLRTALTEIEIRLRPENPDLSLVCERGVIHALLGERVTAQKDLDSARTLGASQWMTLLLETLLETGSKSSEVKK
ncbi:MAG: tetratricopeptide repeat protein [Verrucomicrobiota bacterium]